MPFSRIREIIESVLARMDDVTRTPRFFHKRWPLWLQLTSSLLAVLVMVNFLTASLAQYVVSDFLFKQLEEQIRGSFSLLAATAIDAVITEDIPLLDTIVAQSLEQSPEMIGLSIENERGESLARQIRNDSVIGKRLRHYSFAIEFEGEQFGVINIQWNIEPLHRKTGRHVTEVQFFVSTMLVLLTGLILILVHWLAIRPIRRITMYLKNLSKNRQFTPFCLEASSSSELKLLATSANDLSGVMQQRDQRERELEQTREQLQVAHDSALDASRAKTRFLAAMSHEIRTPMNAVLGILDLLKGTELGSEQQRLIRIGRESGELLMSIINDILEFSKMEAGKLQIENIHFDLHRLLDSSIDLLRPQADHKGLKLELCLDQGLPRYAKGDPDRLRQILLNLVNNAIKFTPSGYVRISASSPMGSHTGFTFRCAVKDTGTGIPDELRTTLFEEFTTADQNHSKIHTGTGLGLAICRRLTSLMHGSIDFGSKIGTGSTFVFTIALEASDAKQCHDTFPDGTQRIPVAGTRILLAEDNPANQVVIKAILENADLQVDVVANGREALEAVRDRTYDIVLMDISMPEMDGVTATQEIRRLPGQSGRIPVVALTAHVLSGNRERFLEAGLDDYLTKPIDRGATLSCIARWTDDSTRRAIESGPVMTQAVFFPNAADDEYVNESVLWQLARDTTMEMVPELIVLYIDDARKLLKQIQQSAMENDAKSLMNGTHSLGSCAAQYGNTRLQVAATRIERLCQQGDIKQAIAQTDSLTLIASESFRLLERCAGRWLTEDGSSVVSTET